MTGTTASLFEAIDATWPPERFLRTSGWLVRVGAGGGKRVSAATVLNPGPAVNVGDAESAMRDLGQDPLFMIRDAEQALDAELAARSYKVVDPVVVLAAPVSSLTQVAVPSVTCFAVWEPLAIMEEIWAQGGIGPARLAVMHRAQLKTGIFGRCENKPAGCGFVAVSGRTAMVHAVEVLPEMRRRGMAGWIMRQAGFWAQAQGATRISVLCTRANLGALGLYSSLGFEEVAEYHYRHKPTEG